MHYMPPHESNGGPLKHLKTLLQPLKYTFQIPTRKHHHMLNVVSYFVRSAKI